MDQTKKTMRHFYCRDVLWDTFERMANDFDCSIDYLINEAMRYYARSKNYLATTTGERPAELESATPPPPPAAAAAAAAAVRSPATPPPPSGGRGGRRRMPPPPQKRRGGGPPPPGGRRRPTDARAGGRSLKTPEAEPAPAAGPTLVLTYNDQRFDIDKDQFIIGRGSKTSDLAIKDGNISRKHAAVIRRNGVFYIKDLGSTNGIDYKGMRIDNKRIDDGDLFQICDYEFRFSFEAR